MLEGSYSENAQEFCQRNVLVLHKTFVGGRFGGKLFAVKRLAAVNAPLSFAF